MEKEVQIMRKQISNTATIQLNDFVEKVFPLFSPLGEKKWVNGWDPLFLYPKSGEFSENLVFKTKSSNTIEKEFNWILSYLNQKDFIVVYTVFTENRVWTIKVQCEKYGNKKTKAKIQYTFTGLNETGDKINKESLEKMFNQKLKNWEDAINYFLETGKMLI